MFKEMQRRALASGSDFDMTYRMVMPSGAVKHLRSSSQRLTELPDRLVYVGATQDITQWKLAEAALRSNEAELRRANDDLLRAYRHIAEAQRLSHTGSFTLDFSKNDLYWSEELYRIFELDPSTTITLDLVKGMVHPEDVPAYLAAVEGAAAGLTIDFAYRIVTNGHIKHLRAVGHRIEHAGDRPMFVGAVQDVTESRLAENALRQGEALLTQAEAVSETGSFLWDLESGDIRWSDELYRIFEFEPHSLITLARIAECVHPDDRSAMEEMIGRAHAGLDSEYFHRICLSGGSVRYLHFVARSFRDEAGQLRYLGTVQNITERTLAEEAFDRVRSELAHAARAMSLGVLTASIAHEVNQPLTSLVTNAGTCIRVLKGPEPDVQLALTMAQRTIRDANRASDVIRRLRAMFSRKRAATEEVDLNEATREVLALSGSTLQSARIVIRARLDEDLPKIRGDRVQLQQVILNLVLNATDAMRSVNDRRRHLTIVTSRGGRREVSLSVRDSGTGVESGNVERLFDAFYTTKSEGMGIGLSISRSIIQGHAGRLWAAPNGDGPGATFTFSIPCDLAASNTEDAREV
jgi:PAS domain S-box-containing protein